MRRRPRTKTFMKKPKLSGSGIISTLEVQKDQYAIDSIVELLQKRQYEIPVIVESTFDDIQEVDQKDFVQTNMDDNISGSGLKKQQKYEDKVLALKKKLLKQYSTR